MMLTLWKNEQEAQAHAEQGLIVNSLSQMSEMLAELPSVSGWNVAVDAYQGGGSYARVTRAAVRGLELLEAGDIWRKALPAYETVSGFRGGYLLLATHSGEGMVITFWDHEKDAQAQSRSGMRTSILSRFDEVMAGPPEVEGFELAAHV